MAMYTSPLTRVRVAAPCSADWERMTGSPQIRFCDQCNLNVYNLSGMTKRDAEALIANSEGRLCVRFYARADGTILTENCPVGLRALRRRVSRLAGACVSAVIGCLSGFGINLMFADTNGRTSLPQYGTMGVISRVETVPQTPPISEPLQVPMMGEAMVTSQTPDAKWVQGRMPVERNEVRQKRGRK